MMAKKVFSIGTLPQIKNEFIVGFAFPFLQFLALKGGVTFPLLACKLFNEMPMQSENILIFCFILLLLETGGLFLLLLEIGALVDLACISCRCCL